uniref:Reverse transcriptase domain-containing protein n=1 Tax=Arion vulgaris TaxID=1028688 RepID=A0A0B7BV32_9EUPU
MTAMFTLQELEDQIKKLKEKKAPGADGITNEFLKHLGPLGKRFLLSIFNQCWKTGQVPSTWKEAHIYPILKPGKNKNDPKIYGLISLLSCAGKWRS